LKALEVQKKARRKRRKENVEREECNGEEYREGQPPVRELFLQLPGERVPLPGNELPVRLRQASQRQVIGAGIALCTLVRAMPF
jgi:hypothetical protein